MLSRNRGGSGSYNFFGFDSCNSFTYANCDWWCSTDSSEYPVSVVLPDTTFNPSNTELFLVLPNVNRWAGTADTFNAVLSSSDDPWGSSAYSSSTKTMNIVSEGKINIAPAGLKYELVVITNKNGTYYYWETSGTIPDGGIKATAALSVQSVSQITTKLKSL